MSKADECRAKAAECFEQANLARILHHRRAYEDIGYQAVNWGGHRAGQDLGRGWPALTRSNGTTRSNRPLSPLGQYFVLASTTFA